MRWYSKSPTNRRNDPFSTPTLRSSGMGFLDSIEKLINEHGSAVILRERITLAHEQFAVLEKKATDLQLKVDGLKSENDSLKVDKLTLEKKVRNLEEQLVERRGQRLEEIREKLLTALSSGHELKAQQLAQSLGIGEQLVHIPPRRTGQSEVCICYQVLHWPTDKREDCARWSRLPSFSWLAHVAPTCARRSDALGRKTRLLQARPPQYPAEEPNYFS